MGKELVTKYFSLISRRFEYVWLQYSYVGLWFTVRCDKTQEEKTCQFQQQGTLSLLTARPSPEQFMFPSVSGEAMHCMARTSIGKH